MAVNTCTPCTDPCIRATVPHHESAFRSAVFEILCGMAQAQTPASILRINGTYTGSNQEVIAAQGAGKKIRVRSLVTGTEDSSTDYQFFSRSAGGVNTAITPNFDYLSNAGSISAVNTDGWFETLPNESLVITSNANVDLLGTAEVVAG